MSEKPMNILIVGTGAVAQVFGYHLHRGGSAVTFLSRSKGNENGFLLYHLNQRTSRERPITFDSFEWRSDISELEDEIWDQVHLCLPSNALNSELIRSLSSWIGDATVVTTQPGLEDAGNVRERFGLSRVVVGMIAFAAYAAPLRGERVTRPGTAYWFYPFSKSPFNGPTERPGDVVAALQAGGFPAEVNSRVESTRAFLVAVQTALTAGMEIEGFSLQRFWKSDRLDLPFHSMKEALGVVEQHYGRNPPWFLRTVNKKTVRLALPLFAPLFPVDLESFLEFHYSKLHSQTLSMLSSYITLGEKQGRRVTALKEIVDLLNVQSPQSSES
jgi:2-dehydropantoate 2-reductase